MTPRVIFAACAMTQCHRPTNEEQSFSWLNAPLGHAVYVVQHPPEHRETSTDKIERALNALIEDGTRSQSRNGQGEPD